MTFYKLVFFGIDGEFEYVYSDSLGDVEWAFRVPRLRGLTWTFDGDGWSSALAWFDEAGKAGHWYITRS